eukprot:Ihof_evm3s160 gene=Ihof_evmTU3s160
MDLLMILDKIFHGLLAYVLVFQVFAMISVLLGPGEQVTRWIRSQPKESPLFKMGLPALVIVMLTSLFAVTMVYLEAAEAKSAMISTGDNKVTPYSTYFRSQRDLYMTCWATINVFVILGVLNLRTKLQTAEEKNNTQK